MSHSDKIVWQDGFTSGNPRLGGIQLAIEPASGWSLGLNRLRAVRRRGARQRLRSNRLFKAIFNPVALLQYQPGSHRRSEGHQSGGLLHQQPDLSRARFPFAVYAEYAGEDTSRGRSYLLGNSALSWGIHFPRLWERFDLTLEASEWQNAWYVHSVYQDGMTNYGIVVGNWFGDQRVFNDGVGGRSAMARVVWDAPSADWSSCATAHCRTRQYGVVPVPALPRAHTGLLPPLERSRGRRRIRHRQRRLRRQLHAVSPASCASATVDSSREARASAEENRSPPATRATSCSSTPASTQLRVDDRPHAGHAAHDGLRP